jgi:hypothetical protein
MPCACAEVCLPSRNLETVCIKPLFHCRCVYYLEPADSVGQTFLHWANTPQYHADWQHTWYCFDWESIFSLGERLLEATIIGEDQLLIIVLPLIHKN